MRLLHRITRTRAGRIWCAHQRGGCYLTIIIGLLAREGTSSKARLLCLLPGVEGLLGLRTLDQTQPPAPGAVTKTRD